MSPPKMGRPPLPDAQRAGAWIQLRITHARKAAYVRASSRGRLTLAAWAFRALDRESGYKSDDA